MNETPTESERKQRFFAEIERVFLHLRGSPLLLSPSDWRVASDWFDQQIPLTVVTEALETFFADRTARGSTKKVNSLRYCGPAVEELWGDRLELGMASAVAEGVGFVVSNVEAARLEELASSLPTQLPQRQAWVDRLTQLQGSKAVVEARLSDVENELLKALEDGLGRQERQALEARTQQALEPWMSTLDGPELERLRVRLSRNFLRELFELPVLTQL